MSKKQYDYFYNEFEKLYEILSHKKEKFSLEDCIEMSYNPYQWLTDYFKFTKKILNDFTIINPEWTNKYFEERKKYPNEATNLPEIYLKFKNLISSIHEENYELSSQIKKEIELF